jgi:hypothetical protein
MVESGKSDRNLISEEKTFSISAAMDAHFMMCAVL